MDSEDVKGMVIFIESLKHNTTLISLNLANNKLGLDMGKEVKTCLEQNHSLIDFEFGFNGFHLNETRKIQEYLRRNKSKYDEERLREWNERRHMRGEDEALQNKYLTELTRKEQKRMEEEAKDERENEIEQKWRKFILEAEIDKQMTI